MGAKRAILAALVIVCVADLAGAQALRPVPAFRSLATDLTGTLDPDAVRSLESRLQALEKEIGSQVAVLLVETTEPEAIEQYSLRVAEAWRLGRGGADDGVLVLVAVGDRDMRIEVGYGLEGALPDARANRILDEQVAPRFAAGDYAGGLEAGIEAIGAAVRGEELPAAEPRANGAPDIGGLLPVLLILGLTVGGFLKRAFGTLPGAALSGGVVGAIVWFIVGIVATAVVAGIVAFVIVLFMSGGHGSWSSGRGYGGGFGGGFGGRGGFGGGGFRGGGGGRFGGGGASGSW